MFERIRPKTGPVIGYFIDKGDSLCPDQTIHEAYSFFEKNYGINGIPVVKNGKVKSVVSRKEVEAIPVAMGMLNEKAEKIAHKKHFSADFDELAAEVLSRAQKRQILQGEIVLVNRKGKFIGFLSADELTKRLALMSERKSPKICAENIVPGRDYAETVPQN